MPSVRLTKPLGALALMTWLAACSAGGASASPPVAPTTQESSAEADPPSVATPLVEDVGGTKVVTLRGTASERGAAVGSIFREEIQSKTEPYVRDFLTELLGGTEKATEHVNRMEPQIPEEARQQMRALADAAEVGYEQIVLLNVFSDVLTVGCTTIAASGQRSHDKAVRLARNVDLPMPPDMQPPAFVAIVHPEQGLAYAGYTWPGMVGPPSAINAEGVALVINGSRASPPPDGPCLPIAFAARQALTQSTSARELLGQLSQVEHCGGFVVTAADRSEIGALEIAPGRTELLTSPDGLLTVTNHFQTEPMAPLQLGDVEESRGRLDVVRQSLVSSQQGLGTAELQQALMHEEVVKPFTILSVVIEPAEGTMWLWERGDQPGSFRQISVSDRLVP